MSHKAKAGMSNPNEGQVREHLVNLAADRPQIYQAAQDWFIQQGEAIIPELMKGLDEEYLGAICHGRILLLLRHFAQEKTFPAILEALRKALRRGDYIVLPRAMEALSVFRTPAASHTLVELTKESDPDIVKHAAALLGTMGDATAMEPLLGLLDNNDPFVRYSAARALIQLGVPAVRPALARHLKTETDAEVQELLISAGIGKLRKGPEGNTEAREKNP